MSAATVASPAAIDTEIARLISLSRRPASYAAAYANDIHRQVGDRKSRETRLWGLSTEEAVAKLTATDPANYYLAKYAEAAAELAELNAQIDELQDRYSGWSRFFLVANSGGHIHSSRHCSTCFPTTQFSWLPELSGKSEEEAVAAHGARLCSVCFPSAPIEWRNHWELEAAKKKAASCPGSGTRNWSEAPDYSYYRPRAGVCGDCGQYVTPTSRTTGKIRRHKPAK